jgi:hypothetical protein
MVGVGGMSFLACDGGKGGNMKFYKVFLGSCKCYLMFCSNHKVITGYMPDTTG